MFVSVLELVIMVLLHLNLILLSILPVVDRLLKFKLESLLACSYSSCLANRLIKLFAEGRGLCRESLQVREDFLHLSNFIVNWMG